MQRSYFFISTTLQIVAEQLIDHFEVVDLKLEDDIEGEAATKWDDHQGFSQLRVYMNEVNHNGQTALQLFAENEFLGLNPDMLNLFLRLGANPNVTDSQGNTVLMILFSKGYHQQVVEMVKYSKDLEVRNLQGCTLLMLALTANSRDVVDVLMDQNVDCTCKVSLLALRALGHSRWHGRVYLEELTTDPTLKQQIRAKLREQTLERTAQETTCSIV